MASNALVRTCGTKSAMVALLSIPADVLSWFIAKGYDPVAQTISALAVGRSSWLIDLGILCFTAGCLALGGGMRALKVPQIGWRVGALAIIGAGLAAAVIAFVNQYAGRDNAGANIHMWMVYAL